MFNGPKRFGCIVLLGLIVLLRPAAAAEDSGRVYAVVTLIGDALRIVGDEPTTGTKIGRNAVEVVPLTFDVLEVAALKAATDAVLQADASARAAPLKITDPAIYAKQDEFFDGTRATLPEGILKPLRGSPVTHLLLVTRYRADARMDTGLLRLGNGKVEGVGYYLDREFRLRLIGTNEVTVGYLAPYVYMRVSVIDLATSTVEHTQISTTGKVLTASGTGTADPWTILDSAGKIMALRNMINEQLEATVPRVVRRP